MSTIATSPAAKLAAAAASAISTVQISEIERLTLKDTVDCGGKELAFGTAAIKLSRKDSLEAAQELMETIVKHLEKTPLKLGRGASELPIGLLAEAVESAMLEAKQAVRDALVSDFTLALVQRLLTEGKTADHLRVGDCRVAFAAMVRPIQRAVREQLGLHAGRL